MFHGRLPNLAIANVAGVCGSPQRVERELHLFVFHDQFQVQLRQEVYLVLVAAIALGLTVLAAEAASIGYRQTDQTSIDQR